jgi:hypothetical protein
MNDHCRYELDVTRAAREGRWTEALQSHLASCEDCQAAASVAGFMEMLAEDDVRVRALPSASAVWLKAQLLRDTLAAERISRPFTVFQWLAYFVVASGWAGLMTWKWDVVRQWLLSFTPTRVIQSASGLTAPSIPLAFYAGIVVLASLTMFLALHTILAEE